MKNKKKEVMKGKYQSMIEESEALCENIQEGHLLSPIILSSQKNSYRGLGMKVRDASITIRRRISLEKNNLTDKGKFCEFVAQILKQSMSDNWKKDWSWYAVKDYYEEQMRKRNPSFLSDVAKPRRNAQEYMQNIANIKKMITAFGFMSFMQMLYFALNDPKDLYFYNFFNCDFKLCKMNQEDRLRKIKGIMDSKDYWSEKETSIMSIEDLKNSNELREEKKLQAIAQLSPSKQNELAKLEESARVALKERLNIEIDISNLEENLNKLERLLRTYEKNIKNYNYTKERAIAHLSKHYNEGRAVDIDKIEREVVSLGQIIEEKETKLNEVDLIIKKPTNFKREYEVLPD